MSGRLCRSCDYNRATARRTKDSGHEARIVDDRVMSVPGDKFASVEDLDPRCVRPLPDFGSGLRRVHRLTGSGKLWLPVDRRRPQETPWRC